MDDKDKAKQTNGRNCWFGWWALSRQRVVCLAAGTASLLLVLVAFIFELREEGHSVRLVAIAAVFVLQVGNLGIYSTAYDMEVGNTIAELASHRLVLFRSLAVSNLIQNRSQRLPCKNDNS